MTKSKLALDNETERELLIDLWNIEEMAERKSRCCQRVTINTNRRSTILRDNRLVYII